MGMARGGQGGGRGPLSTVSPPGVPPERPGGALLAPLDPVPALPGQPARGRHLHQVCRPSLQAPKAWGPEPQMADVLGVPASLWGGRCSGGQHLPRKWPQFSLFCAFSLSLTRIHTCEHTQLHHGPAPSPRAGLAFPRERVGGAGSHAR